jgi:hypothetical protein
MGAKGRSPEVDRYLARVEEPVRGAVRWLRELVLDTAPGLREGLMMGVPTYTGKAPVCYIADYTQHANLGFHKGALIRDSRGILEGTGKGLRHVKVKKRDKGLEAKLRALILDAVAIDKT